LEPRADPSEYISSTSVLHQFGPMNIGPVM
jgi:hypothetical protein